VGSVAGTVANIRCDWQAEFTPAICVIAIDGVKGRLALNRRKSKHTCEKPNDWFLSLEPSHNY